MPARHRAALAVVIIAALAIWFVPPLLNRLHADGPEATLWRLGWHLGFGIAFGGLAVAAVQLDRSRHAEWGVPLSLLAMCVLIRFPFWFPYILNGDEGGLIVTGQALLDGHLPFTKFWDVKPPGAVAVMSLIVAAGRSVVTVRIGGALMLFAGAWMLAAGRDSRRHGGVFAAIMLLVFVGAAEAGQATMTEHLALPPMCAALAVALRPSYRRADVITIGILLGCAIAIRTNLVFLVPAAAFAVAIRSSRAWRNNAILLVSAAAPSVAVALLYLAAGHWDAFIRGVFMAPLALPQVTLLQLPWQIDDLAIRIARDAAQTGWLLWAGALGGFLRATWKGGDPFSGNAIVVAAFLAATLLSLMAMSVAEAHYLMMAIPFAACLAGNLLARLLESDARRWAAWPIAIGLLIPLMNVPGQYAERARALRNGDGWLNDDGHRVARFLEEHGAADRYVYALDHSQASAWMAGGCPAGRFVDPGQIMNPPLLAAFAGNVTAESEWLEGFRHEPEFVISNIEAEFPDAVSRRLAAEYGLVATLGGHLVYRRLVPGSPGGSC
jgi:hypothetical protein